MYRARAGAVPRARLDLARWSEAKRLPRSPHAGPWPVRVMRWPLDLLRTLVRVIPQAIDGFFADRCGQHAAGIAYRVLFSLVPLSIILVAIFGECSATTISRTR